MEVKLGLVLIGTYQVADGARQRQQEWEMPEKSAIFSLMTNVVFLQLLLKVLVERPYSKFKYLGCCLLSMARVVHVNAKCSVKKSYHFSPWRRLLGKMQVLKRHKGIISYLQGIHTPGGALFNHLLCLCKRYEIHALMQNFPWLYSMMLYKLSSCCIYFIILYFFTACFIHVLVVPNQSFPCETEKLMM